jgi:predicted RNA-binding Zn-ribbon protein involved in translation (DUF1610 family)
MKKEDIWVKVCPKCHSLEVTSRGALSEKALSPNFVCQTCGFQSAVFPEIKLEDAQKLPEQPRKFVPSRMPIATDYARLNEPGPVLKLVGKAFLALILLVFILFIIDMLMEMLK